MSEHFLSADIFLHCRKGISPLRVRDMENALEVASEMLGAEPFQVTDGEGEVLLDEDDLKAQLGL